MNSSIHLLRLLVLSLFCSFCVQSLSAQITIASGDLPSVGDMVTVDVADTLLFLDPEPTGADFTWDFTSLTSAQTIDQEYVAPSSTEFTYFLLWAAANQALPAGGSFEIGDLAVDGGVEFFNKDASRYQQTGLAGSLGGVPIPFSFDPPDRIVEFPMNFGDVHGGPSAFSLEIPGLFGIWEERDRSCEVDGWGTLQLPGGDYAVLRQRCEIVISDSITGDFGDFNIDRETREFRWWGIGGISPILRIDVQVFAGVPTVGQAVFQGGAPVSSIDETIKKDFVVTRNADFLQVSFPHPNQGLTLYDMSGRVLARVPAFINQTQIDISHIDAQLLVVQLQTESGWVSQKVLR